MGKFGLEQTSPILHNLKPLALSKAVRDSLGELGGGGGTFLGRWGWRGCSFWMLLNGAEITPACAAAKLRAFSFLLRLEFYSYSGSLGLWKLFFPSYTDTILLLTKSLWANCCYRNTCCNRTACPHFLSSWLFLRCAGQAPTLRLCACSSPHLESSSSWNPLDFFISFRSLFRGFLQCQLPWQLI